MNSIFINSDVMVMPYKHIDASGALVKAMEYNLPVIASNLGGFQELIDDNETGFLFEPSNHKELSEHIENILQNAVIRENMRIKINKKSLTVDTWDDLAATCIKAYINEPQGDI